MSHINVNLGVGSPVEVPCAIPPTVTLKVRLGACSCDETALEIAGHLPRCPARSIEVTCTIGGDGTWAGSEVTDYEFDIKALPKSARWNQADAVVAACRDRWALVMALVLNQPIGPAYTMVEGVRPLAIQRDAVFSALAKACRAEDALNEALGDYEEAMRGEPVGIYGLKREADGALARYVERLVEQVGNL